MSAIQEAETEQEEGKVFQNRTHTADTVCLIKGEQAKKERKKESTPWERNRAITAAAALSNNQFPLLLLNC